MNLTIEQAIAIAGVLAGTKTADPAPPANINIAVGSPVIVRSRDAGVLFGEYAGNDGSTVHLKSARQMWRWHAAEGGTLIDCATHGVIDSKCKFSPSRATVTVFNACALISCTAAAASSIMAVKGSAWK